MNTNNRELRRQYKLTPPPMGIYLIRNTVNQRVFVGASTNVQGAINRERFDLQQKSHRNSRLLQDWLAYGSETFTFEVLSTVLPRTEPDFDYKAELASLLELWREELQCYGESGYNTNRVRAGS
ncbi:MAG TPA: GIY-YIG nuclease family protein [Polaromonas sp.]|uniref:GIY-YIG nuclease family protein n=1 Tax=Polaromonas sp. TaxID=1869339 RepID=UPI002D255EF3|nr:GIY-YIG nuclease family protein [Polaromonas sp.]HYW57489.1 GIY-YIG nuclease family protein [Polaromonas sp.]